MYQRTLDLEYDKLVIGSDLSALSYCYTNLCPALYLRVDSPYPYNEKENWKVLSSLWNELALVLATSKYIPFSDKIVSLRLENDNLLKAVTKDGIVTSIKFNNLIISNDTGIEGLPPATGKTSTDNWVLDWNNINVGSRHPLEFIEDNSNNFVKKVYFYISKRIAINTTKKDLVAVSKIDDRDLNNPDYSENIARLKTLRMMKDAGIKGKWDKSNNCFIKPRISSTHRQIFPLGKNIYSDLPKNISMLYDDYTTILNGTRKNDEAFEILKDKYGIRR